MVEVEPIELDGPPRTPENAATLFMLQRWAKLALAVAACVLLCGCWVYSVYPLTEGDDQLVMDKSLLGTWWQPEAGCTLTLSRFFEEKVYRVAYAAPPNRAGGGCLIENGRSAAFEGRLVKLNGYQFLDLYPADRETQHHDLALHSIYKVNRLGDRLSLVPFDFEWMKTQWRENKLSAPAKEGENSLVLTLDTDALQHFVSDHAASDEAFNPGKQITFHKRSE